MEAQNAEIPEIPVPPVNETADVVIILGALTGTCEVIKDSKGKHDCRKLVEPLEHGKKSAVDALASMMVSNPNAVDEMTDRMNFLIQEASKKAEEMVKSGEAPMQK